MSIPESHAAEQPSFLFGHTRRDYADLLQRIPTKDLIAELEAAQWLALDMVDVPSASRAVAEIQAEELVEELERRQRLLKAHPLDPLRPAWPRPDGDLTARIEAVKTRWPIVRFCEEVLGADLEPAGKGRWKAHCPMPNHDDSTPSFLVYESSDSAYCFGCQRGGDVIALTKFAFSLERFTDALDRLEEEGGVQWR